MTCERPATSLRVGIDFDNTLVCHDHVFCELAVEQGLVPQGECQSRLALRERLWAEGYGEAWTRLQGEVYGVRMGQATPFAGVREFLELCLKWGTQVVVVSHRTRQPALGPACDLHAVAWAWLAEQGLLHSDVTGLSQDNMFFEESVEAKAARINKLGCTHFVDDLPEFLSCLDAGNGMQRILFDPGQEHSPDGGFLHAVSWNDVTRHICGGERTFE